MEKCIWLIHIYLHTKNLVTIITIRKRNRKLLLNKKEINKLIGRVNREGFTLIPTKLYFKKAKQRLKLLLLKERSNMIKDMLRKEEIGIERNLDILENLAKLICFYWD